MASSVTLWGATYSDVPAINVPSGNGTARFTDVSDSTVTASTMVSGTKGYDSTGAEVTGTLVIKTYYTGTSAPSSSLGSDGDIYLQTSS